MWDPKTKSYICVQHAAHDWNVRTEPFFAKKKNLEFQIQGTPKQLSHYLDFSE